MKVVIQGNASSDSLVRILSDREVNNGLDEISSAWSIGEKQSKYESGCALNSKVTELDITRCGKGVIRFFLQ